MAVNLLVDLGQRFGADVLAQARARADRAGYRLLRVDAPDERLAAWIDWQFAPSWWSAEACAGSAWYAERDGEIVGFVAFGARNLPFPWLRAYRDAAGVGVFGPYGVAEAERGSGIGAALLDAALCSLAPTYAQALIPAVGDERLSAMYARRTGARIVERFTYDVPRARAVILASGSGTNAQNVIDHVSRGDLALDLVGVLTNKADAFVLERARTAGVPTDTVVWARGTESRAQFDARVIETLARHEPDLVLLLGWMHLLPAEFLQRFPQTLNVHPAFLPFDPRAELVTMPDGSQIPAFRGAHAPEATAAAGVAWAGASVHRVTVEVDRGGILVRTPVRLARGASVDDVAAAIHPLEYAAVPKAIRRWLFERAAAQD